jgi:tetratricopeptide (TPR) repeat protein
MGFFKRIFGGASFDDERKEADALFEAKNFEEARIAYQRAIDRKKDASADAVEHCQERIGECLDRMAEQRIEEAERLTEEGHIDLAETELRNAAELAASDEIAKRARELLELLEQKDAKERASLPAELDDDDRWALIAGNWEGPQEDEYEEYGDELRGALLALHDNEAKKAREALEALLEEADEAVYLWLEVGRARILDKDDEAAEEALRMFLDRLDEDEGGPTRLSALAELAGIRERAGDEAGAIAELEKAMEAFPEEPLAYYWMGRHLHIKGHAEEAVEVLEAGAVLLDEDNPDVGFLELLGVACLAAEEDEKAIAYLDRVIARAIAIRRLDGEPVLRPDTAMARAALHEKAGEHEKAAGLYRSLARGPDRANHFLYHREAGRLLVEADLPDEAHRMLTRAKALAPDAAALADIERRLAELD